MKTNILFKRYVNNQCKEFFFYSSGGKEWHLDGRLHNENGPAHEGLFGNKEWFLNGILYKERVYTKAVKEYKEKKKKK